MNPRAPALVELAPDHPGFRDSRYRARRDELARLALAATAEAAGKIRYLPVEHEVWSQVVYELAQLRRERMVTPLLELERELALDPYHVPQLADLNRRFAVHTGFRMHPVAGLVEPRAFLERLAHRVFLSTQYVRHPAAPFYTPEPDIIHEVLGHAASLCHPGLTRVQELFGQRAGETHDPARIERLANVYWYTLEFGLVREDEKLKAIGAGLLSSVEELGNFERARLLPWDLEQAARTTYDPTRPQAELRVADSFEHFVHSLSAWLEAERV
jgi:phenylalanine-4-hydroxylase